MPDLRAAIDTWVTVYGAGPFYVLEHVAYDECTASGTPAVWDHSAWLDPRLMSRWFAPAGFTVRKAEVDKRVGGRLRIWRTGGEDKDVGGSESEIVERVGPGWEPALDTLGAVGW